MKKVLVIFVLWQILTVRATSQTVFDIIASSPHHQQLEEALLETNLSETLSQPGPFTVFAPSNAAFDAADSTALSFFLSDSARLVELLTYHLVGDSLAAADLQVGNRYNTLQGKDITINDGGTSILINDARLEIVNIPATNGIVHFIDAVLLVPEVTLVDVVNVQDSLSMFASLLEGSSVSNTLDTIENATLFAPTNSAFDLLGQEFLQQLQGSPAFLDSVILFHATLGNIASLDTNFSSQKLRMLNERFAEVLRDTTAFKIENALININPLPADNGTVYIIDAVLQPPKITIFDYLASNEEFDSLAAVLVLAGRDSLLRSSGPFTFFAPTDEALATLSDSAFASILRRTDRKAANLFDYHILDSLLVVDSITDQLQLETRWREDLTFSVVEDSVFVGGQLIVFKNVFTDNGVIHVVENILIPRKPTLYDLLCDRSELSIFKSIVDSDSLKFGFDTDTIRLSLFAPVDAAFGDLEGGFVDSLIANGATHFVKHLTAENILVADSFTNNFVITMQSGFDEVVTTGGSFLIGDAQFLENDAEAENGYLHVVDEVLQPTNILSALKRSTGFSTMAAALDTIDVGFDLTSKNERYSVFAFPDPAYSSLSAADKSNLEVNPQGELKQVLQYHIIPERLFGQDFEDGQFWSTLLGEELSVEVDGNNFRMDEIEFSPAAFPTGNGNIFVIDDLLSPPRPTIADWLADSPNHLVLDSLLRRDGLIELLEEEGSYTLFAPVDAAFERLDSSTFQKIVAIDVALNRWLEFHLLPQAQKEALLKEFNVLETYSSELIPITVVNDTLFLQETTRIDSADILVSNGVIHVTSDALYPIDLLNVPVIDLPNLKVFPNPASSHFALQGLENLNYSLLLLNAAGQIVLKEEKVNELEKISIEGLVSGQYLILMKSEKGVAIQQIIITE